MSSFSSVIVPNSFIGLQLIIKFEYLLFVNLHLHKIQLPTYFDIEKCFSIFLSLLIILFSICIYIYIYVQYFTHNLIL